MGTLYEYVVNNILNRAWYLDVGDELIDTVIDQVYGYEVTIRIEKTAGEKYNFDADTYNYVYRKTASDKARLAKVFDWSTSSNIISWPPSLPSGDAQAFDVQEMESKHTLTHDGNHREFWTDLDK